MFDIQTGLSGETLQLIRGGAVIALVVVVLIQGRRIWKKITSRFHGVFSGYPVKREAEQNREIYTELVELRALTESDRAYVFRFHNGMEFLPSHPAWKLSCTHEVVKHGVTYESAKLQGILVSLIPNIISSVLTGSVTTAGFSMPDCKECPFKTKCLKENKRVIIIQVDEMESSYCKFHLEAQNIKTVLMCGIAKGGSVYGIVGVDFCGAKLTPEAIPGIALRVCRSTDKVQYHLQFRKAPVDLPIPDHPVIK